MKISIHYIKLCIININFNSITYKYLFTINAFKKEKTKLNIYLHLTYFIKKKQN